MANAVAVYKPPKESEPKTDKQDDLTLVLAQFEDAENSTIESRAESELHRQYYDGHIRGGNGQWTAEEVAALNARKQPIITDNKIADKVQYLLGLERKTRADPKAFPRNAPTDEQSADAATDALRYVADQNMFHYMRSDVAENMFIEGLGGVEIVIDKKYGGRSPKVCVRRIRWDRLYADPHSMECDYSDAKYKGFMTWMDHDEAVARWKDKKDVIDATIPEYGVSSETYDDKPRYFLNAQGRKRVQIFTHYYKRAERWFYCVFVKGGFLEEPSESAYEDEFGEPECPLEFQALYRQGDDGAAYGQIRRYKDLQDDWNKRRSKSLHLLSVNQVEGEEGAFEDIEKTRKEAARPDGVILRTPGMLGQINRGLDLAQGHIQLMMLTGQALEATGPNAALQGTTGSISGRAKQIDQQGGQTQIDKPFDAVRYLTLRIYRQMWNRIKQFWTQEMWIRVRDEEQVKFIALNKPKMWAQIIAEQLQKMPWPDEEKEAILQQVAADPKFRQLIVTNHVATLDVDITIDEGPDVVTLQQEQFAVIADLMKAGLQIPPKALIRASSLRNKQELLDEMSGGDDPAAQQMAALQQKMGELEALLKEANIRKVMSEVAKNEAATVETQADSSIKIAEFTDPAQPATPKTQVSVN